MNPIVAEQLELLRQTHPDAIATPLGTGGHLITVPNVELPDGWNRRSTTVLFVTPPGYPSAQPDCFWVEPTQFRLANQGTPQGSNDSNPIPGLNPPRQFTWFSWHLQSWNPNRDSLITYLNVIMKRFESRQ
jgi:E2/UBC family protein E